MAKLKDTEIDGNLYVSGDIQIGDTDVMNKLDELNTKIDSKIIYEEYAFPNISFSAGTVSTRALQYSKNVVKDGYRIISTTITYILDSSLIIPIHFFSSSLLYLNIYRATANSVSNNEVRITVAYEKI